MLSDSLSFTGAISDIHGINFYNPTLFQITAKTGLIQPIKVAGLNLLFSLLKLHCTETMK
jgi:hypothetical protein